MTGRILHRYVLPSSPEIQCVDRFSILDSDDDQVVFWDIFVKLLSQDVKTARDAIDILETIAVTLRGSEGKGFGLLKTYLQSRDDFAELWQHIVSLALQMPVLFPTHALPILSFSNPKVSLTRIQVACLVSHHCLCTFRAPDWQDGYQNFDIWYSEDPIHPEAMKTYLSSLFEYFDRTQTFLEDSTNWTVSYELHQSTSLTECEAHRLKPLEIIHLKDYCTDQTDLLGVEDGACVISANKYVGFGRSATQEEVHVGTALESCPAVLITPPLETNQVLVVRGAEAIGMTRGQARQLKFVGVRGHDSNVARYRSTWEHRTMLFMDALELDVTDQFLDLQPDNVSREFRKAYTAFSSHDYSTATTGMWGCRTFGGDANVKIPILWCAASAADVTIRVICTPDESKLAKDLQELAAIAEMHKLSVKQVRDALDALHASRVNKEAVAEQLKAVLAGIK